MKEIWEADEDIRSLKSLILFGIRGMAAYAYHAAVLGYEDETVNAFFYKALSFLGFDLEMGDLLPVVLEVGEVNLKCMELLDQRQHRDIRQSEADKGAAYRGEGTVYHHHRSRSLRFKTAFGADEG